VSTASGKRHERRRANLDGTAVANEHIA
jgi:hypothetical protein